MYPAVVVAAVVKWKLLIERHLDFYIKRNLIELRISQFLLRYIKSGNDSFKKMLRRYNINY